MSENVLLFFKVPVCLSGIFFFFSILVIEFFFFFWVSFYFLLFLSLGALMGIGGWVLGLENCMWVLHVKDLCFLILSDGFFFFL